MYMLGEDDEDEDEQRAELRRKELAAEVAKELEHAEQQAKGIRVRKLLENIAQVKRKHEDSKIHLCAARQLIVANVSGTLKLNLTTKPLCFDI